MIRQATKQAEKSTFHRARIGAVITRKDRVLSTGYNDKRYYSNCPTSRVWIDSLHAEQSAILKLLKSGRQADLVGAYIYVSRVKKNGKPGLAKPCPTCQELINAVGIRKVFYTTDEGSVECIVI